MSDPKDVVLNAIRVLRSRRVRPSDAKIAWLARREYLQGDDVTARTLQELVQCGDVFKVLYKGGTSYRVAPHKVAASNKFLPKPSSAPPSKKVKFTPTPTDILRPLLSAIAACGDNATKERIAEELASSGHRTLVDRLETLLQKELRVGLIGRKVVPQSNGQRNVALYFITKSAPLALISNCVGSTPSNPSPKQLDADPKTNPDCETQSSCEDEPTKKNSTPFEHLRLHLQKLQREKGGEFSRDTTSEGETPSPPLLLTPATVTPNTDELPDGESNENSNAAGAAPLSPEQTKLENENQNTEAATNKSLPSDETSRYFSRRGRPRKAPTIYEDLTNLFPKREKCRSSNRSASSSAATSNNGHRSGRSGAKKARKVFDPSDAADRKKCSVTSSSSLMQLEDNRNLCSVCGQFSSSNGRKNDDLLICCTCRSRAHPSCLGYSNELAMKCRLAPWTCMDCKHCSVCNMDHNTGMLIFCDECDRAYHLTCHNPPIQGYPTGTWICFSCSPNSGYDNVHGLLTPSDSPIPDDETRNSSGSWDSSDPAVPDASTWAVQAVTDYFIEKGFTNEAQVFSEQDIDGTALLMLTRNDVLTGLSLKLGPALKIYKHVRILQTRMMNPCLP